MPAMHTMNNSVVKKIMNETIIIQRIEKLIPLLSKVSTEYAYERMLIGESIGLLSTFQAILTKEDKTDD